MGTTNTLDLNNRINELEDVVGNLLNGAVFEPFQVPGTNPFAEGGSGYILKVKYNDTVLGYMAIRQKGFATPSGRKCALELYDTSWNVIWEVHRDYPV